MHEIKTLCALYEFIILGPLPDEHRQKKCPMFYSFRFVKLSLINLLEIFSQNKVSFYAIIHSYFSDKDAL